MCDICDRLPDELPGKAVADIPGLAAHLEEMTTDFKLWITPFRCKECGKIWEERYSRKGMPMFLRSKR
jgi:hypothetical protein